MGVRTVLVAASGQPCAELSTRLAQCGFGVQVAAGLDAAARVLGEAQPALIVVCAEAAAAPDACRLLRALSPAPIAVVCTRHDEELVVHSLRAGADSVLLLPLSRRELAARLNALLKRGTAVPAGAGGGRNGTNGPRLLVSRRGVGYRLA